MLYYTSNMLLQREGERGGGEREYDTEMKIIQSTHSSIN